jgi:peptidoglycan/LPS O-acetylase OafA/YrhL
MNNTELPIKSENPSAAVVAGGEAAADAEPDGPPELKQRTAPGLLSRLNARFGAAAYFKTAESAETVMDRHGGAGPGFDTLRIVLAMLIMGFHGSQILHGRAAADFRQSNLFPVTLALVPLFFCLSGFLVTGSAMRTRSIKKFLTNRSLRIFPALTVEVFLCAVVLGPILTDLDLKSYFSEIKFYSYFGNIIGRVRMSLPGVFTDNPIPDTVNASLWTLQPEFYCYLLMTLLMFTALISNKKMISTVFIGICLLLSVVNLQHGIGTPTDVFPAHVIIFYFFCGIIAYQWRSRIRLNKLLFLLAAAASYFAITTPGLVYLTAIPVTYVMVYLGLLNLPLIKPFSNGDYSYGIYLFNFPIQQSIMKIFPAMDNWWVLMSISIPATLIFSAFSWHYIEKPALSLKNRKWSKNPGYIWLGGLLRPPGKN